MCSARARTRAPPARPPTPPATLAGADVTGINVDKTPPVLTAAVPSGWHTGDVTVNWSCTDALSGARRSARGLHGDAVRAATCRRPASCTDIGRQHRDHETVAGIQIDRTAPTTTAIVAGRRRPAAGTPARCEVTLTGHRHAVRGRRRPTTASTAGPPQDYNGAVLLRRRGHSHHHLLEHRRRRERRGQPATPLTLKIDRNAPTTTVINPISPATGWFVTSGIPVAFAANDAESGIASDLLHDRRRRDADLRASEFTADLSTGTHTITYWSVDLAGNIEAKQNTSASTSTPSPPTITGTQTPCTERQRLEQHRRRRHVHLHRRRLRHQRRGRLRRRHHPGQ